jgi:ABC-type glycerol-3-phosphate transport system substrate-binding protein
VFTPPDSVSYQWAEVENALVSGNASMITFKGSFLRGWLQNSGQTAEELNVVPIPKPDGKGQDFSLSYSNAFMVMTDDPARQAGIESFMKFFLQDETYGTWLATAEPGLFLPVSTTAEGSEGYTTGEIISQFPNQMAEQNAINATSKLYGFTQDAYCPEVGEFEGQLLAAKAVERMIVNEETPEQAVAWLQSEMDAIASSQN